MKIKLMCETCGNDLPHHFSIGDDDTVCLLVDKCNRCFPDVSIKRSDLGNFLAGEEHIQVRFIKKDGSHRILTGHAAGYVDGVSRMYFWDSDAEQLKSIIVTSIYEVVVDGTAYEVI